MDKKYIAQTFKSMTAKPQTILSTAIYCWYQKAHAKEILPIMFRQFSQPDHEFKLSFFHLLNELLRRSSTSSDSRYIKAICQKIKAFALVFAKTINLWEADVVMGLVHGWEEKQIFSKDLIEKLKQIISQPNKLYYVPSKNMRLVGDEGEEEGEPNKSGKNTEIAEEPQYEKDVIYVWDEKYSQTFLLDYIEIMDLDITKLMYEGIENQQQARSRMVEFELLYQSFPMYCDVKDEMSVEEYYEKLEEVVVNGDSCKEEFIQFAYSLVEQVALLESQSLGLLREYEKLIDDEIIGQRSQEESFENQSLSPPSFSQQ